VAKNKFSKALRHLKSTELDEKIKGLNESPTNSIGGVYALNQPGQRLSRELDPAKVFYPDVDGNWPAGIPGTPGEPNYIRPAGYWDEGPGATVANPYDTLYTADWSYSILEDNPRNTETLIDPDTGYVRSELPPNSRSFILGPLVDLYFHNHSNDNRTYVGYVQKDTREFVLLGYVNGRWGNDNDNNLIYQDGFTSGRIWNGESSGFVATNSNFTFEMLQWFHDKLKAGLTVKNASFFNSGGVPVISGGGGTGQPTGSVQGNAAGAGSGDASDGDDANVGSGTGGNPDIGTPQNTPNHGGPEDAQLYYNQQDPKVFANVTADKNARMILNAAMLGLDIAAVLALLFPEPASSAAGAAILGSKLRYVAKFAQAINKFNPFKGSTGLARGLRGSQVGATGLKKGGFEALKGGQNLHKGSKGLLSPGGKGVYSAPKVGQMGSGGLKPGSGGARYAKSGSNPLGGAQGAAGQPGGVVGSITPGGARGIGVIEPQKVVNPQTFQKGQQLFQKIQSGKFPKSNRANQYRQQAQQAGFGSGQTNVPARRLPRLGEDYEYILEQINNYLLLETETASASPSGGGTEVVDGYVDKVSETSSPEQLEKASDDANNIAKEGGKGLSDADLAKIDKDAEAEARRLTNFAVSNPESMDADQLSASADMIYKIDPDWLMESFGRNESLIDTVKVDKLYNAYAERRSYIGSLEHGFSISPEFKRYYNQAEYLHDTYVSQIHFGRDGNGYPQFTNKNTGERIGSRDLLYKKLHEWSDLFNKTWDTFNSKTVRDRVNKDREENDNNYRKQSDILFRPFYIQIVREWNIRSEFSNYANTLSDDPYSLEEIPRGNATYDAASELALLGISAAVARVFVASVGLASATTLTSILKKADGIAKWYNKGRSPGENKMSWRKLLENDWKQRGKPGSGDKGGWDPTRGFRPGVDADKGGFGSGPTPAVRQAIERPFRALMNLFQSYDLKGTLLNEETDKSLESSIDAALKETESIEDLKKVMDVLIKMMETEKNKKQRRLPGYKGESYEPNSGIVLSEGRRKILREIKQPYKLPEQPKQKYKMNFKGKFTAQNTPDVTASKQSDEVVTAKNAAGQTWRTNDKYWSGYESTERMNIIYDHVGHGQIYWDTIVNENQHKKNIRNREIQEHLNLIDHNKAMKEIIEQQTLDAPKDPLLKKVADKLKKQIDYPDKPSKNGYPDTPPPEMVNGFHPKYGKRYKHDKLDPHSAEFMPPTGDPVIDANIKKATNQKEKARKLKNILGKKG